MNWQLPNLIGQTAESLRDRVGATVQPDTGIPEHTLQRPAGSTSNFLRTEYWFPEEASSFAGRVDFLYMAIFWVSLVLFVGIVGVTIYFCIKYRRTDRHAIKVLPSPSHNTSLEILWTVIPSIFLVWVFYEGATGYWDMRVPREDAEEIQVMAQKWTWQFTYPDGDMSSELHLVRDRPTKLVMQSKDVLHSMFIPAFRQKMDIVPGRYTYAYIMPTLEGEFRLSCTEYCGDGHSEMRTMAKVHIDDQRRKADTLWIRNEYPAWQNGQRIYNMKCSGCHKPDVAATGPMFRGLWGKTEALNDGSTVVVDEQYVQTSIWEPNKQIVAGYASPTQMSSFKGQLQEEDINDVIAYLKWLNDPGSVSDQPIGKLEDGGEAASTSQPTPDEEGDKPAEDGSADDKPADDGSADDKPAEEATTEKAEE